MSVRVSVILPVYNGERFLKEAIDSILSQTFTDFELLVLNDGSTDRTGAIIDACEDVRIKHIRNEGNQGLIFTLNKAISLAQGEYIARMDADDIALPQRLEKQVQWLKRNPDTAVVATFSTEIDEGGQQHGFYVPDREIVTAAQIRKAMPRNNCLTHPSIMARTDVMRAYGYSLKQKNIEDYDLWLRLLADNKLIEKIPEPLLLYRIHKSSVTQTWLRRNFFLKHFHCKRRYLAKRLKAGCFNGFDARVTAYMVTDLAMAGGKALKALFKKKA